MITRPPRLKDLERELFLSTDPAAAPVRRKSPKKASILTLRDAMVKPKTQGTAVSFVVDDHPPLEPVVVQPRRAPVAKQQRACPTVSEARCLQDQLAISQASNPRQISLSAQQLTAQAQAFTAEQDEMHVHLHDQFDEIAAGGVGNSGTLRATASYRCIGAL